MPAFQFWALTAFVMSFFLFIGDSGVCNGELPKVLNWGGIQTSVTKQINKNIAV